MKHIIVPTDFSENSLKGLEFALLLAEGFKAEIQMIHVLPHANDKFKSETDLELEGKFKKLEAEISAKVPEVVVQHLIKRGKIFQEVVHQADSFDDSLIVCATHGNSGFEELFIGSNAYRIISYTTRPVFTIRGNHTPNKLRKIVLPIDITAESREKVPFTANVALLFGAEIHVIAISSTDDTQIQSKLAGYSSQVHKYLNAHFIPHQIEELQGQNITDTIIEYAERVNADLISIMSEQEKSITNLVLGSYAHQMINKSPIPVLVTSTRPIGVPTESFRAEGIYTD